MELAPDSAACNDTLGWIYVKKEVYLKALSHLEPAMDELEKNPAYQYHLGKAYAGAGETDKAVAALRRALELSDRFPGAEDARAALEQLSAGK